MNSSAEKSPAERHFLDSLKVAEVRFFIGGVGFYSLAGRALLVVIGFQVYQITHSALALGWLGLVEAVPVMALVLIGGYIADRFNRRKILLIARAAAVVSAAVLALLSWKFPSGALGGLYTAVFAIGVARGFADPAAAAFEAQVVPKHLTVNASSWVTSVWIWSWALGAGSIGFIYDAWGAAISYAVITASFALAWICTALISPKPTPVPVSGQSILGNLSEGWRFVFAHQPLWSAMALDLFAVLFAGTISLLPIFAHDILRVGAGGLGLLNAAPQAGALLITLFATHRPPIERAGRNLILTVAGFGASMVVFAFSRNFLLSMAMLFLSGVFDGVSMVIRRSMVRLLSPDRLRGRIAAANSIFVCASNELGAFQNGMVAAWIGAVPCVAVGGVVTIGIAGAAAWGARQLRELRFDPHTLDSEHSKAKTR